MKRPSMKIAGQAVTRDQLCSAVSAASTAWLRDRRSAKEPVATAKRRHRARTQEEKEAKALATAYAKRMRDAEREARELEKFLARIRSLSRRSQREAEAMLRVSVSWGPSAQPKITSVCPRSLYSRLHPEISARTASALARSRIAADGFKNIVLRKIPRGYGRKAVGTREYRHGEAADLARYILREEALELGIEACFTNIIATEGENALYETDKLSIDGRLCAQIVGFWNALEAFEAEADPDGNVYSHLILAMPHELSPEGRARALHDFCLRLDAIHLPFVASLHRPDENGDARNFHAHIIMAPRPFAIEGPFAWTFEAGKATEFNLTPAIGWLRDQAAAAFNHALRHENNALRYTGVSQAKRGVPATGETHDGPAVTARKRKAQQDQAERDRLVAKLARHVVQTMERQASLGDAIAAEAARETTRGAADGQVLPPALAGLRSKFPDPLELKLLSALDLMEFTAEDRAADRWYSPAFNLAAELRRGNWDLLRNQNGTPELVVESLKPEYRALLDEPALPDIVDEALREAHRQMVRELEYDQRIKREKERIRKERMTWLRGAPVLLFDSNLKVLPPYEHLFPREVIALEGIREAMVDCHIAAMQEQKRAATATKVSAATRSNRTLSEGQAATAPEEAALTPSSISTASAAPAPAEDEAWDQVLDAARRGLGKVSGSVPRTR